MALLAYDPQRVARLRQALGEAVDDLRRVTCTDPAAADAMRVVRSAVAQMDTTWLPLVDRLLASDPLSSAQRSAARINSLDQSLVRVMADGYGWSVQQDPLSDDTTVVTTEEARALAVSLNHVDPEALANDPEQLAWLAQQLAVIGRDPALSAQFLANFHNWDVLPFALARQRVSSYGNDYNGSTVAADIDPVIGGLMSIWRTSVPLATLHPGTAASIADLLPPMRDPDPHVQALMLSALRLDPIALATVTNELLRSWLDDKATLGSALDLTVAFGPNTADILLQGIADNSVASAYFLGLIGDRPALLFQTLDDPEIGYRVALAGTDPTHTSPRAAERAVLAILDYFWVDPYATDLQTDGYAGEFGPFLGQLVAPWLLQFTGANHEWVTDVDIKVSLLAVAMRDEQALQALVAAGQRITDGFAHSLGAADSDEELIAMSQQVGGLVSLLGQLVVNENIHDEASRTHFLWDLTWTILTASASFVPGGVVASVAAEATVTVLEGQLAEYFVAQDVDGVRHDGEFAMDATATVTAAFALNALFQSWVLHGRIDEDATPPPIPLPTDGNGCPSSPYRSAIERWANNLRRDLARTALDLVDSFIGSAQAIEHCAELSRGSGRPDVTFSAGTLGA
ncbi:MAG TPA: hypothetical protein PK020_05995 [Ilumatobacteraceae bacterium]|nr:hypothetical protein [Ilumatobacteraceae bacterium]